MAGASVHIDTKGLERLQRRLKGMMLADYRGLMDALGAEVESQTRRRIEDERRDPEGEAWPEWSERYARTRKSGHRLLQNDGHLVDSIGYLASRRDVQVGSNLIYAASHQFGDADRNIPPRPYLGLSGENMGDLEAVVDAWVDEQLGLPS